MAENRGKQFENVIREAFEKVPETSVVRLPDPTNGYLGIRNISDFIVYHFPYQYFIECKSVHGNTFPFSNITDNQWKGMLDMTFKRGVIAGVIVWWIDKDVTSFFHINMLYSMKMNGGKSVRYDCIAHNGCYPIVLKGKKKRVFFDYDMQDFFDYFK